MMPEILTESFCERCGTRYTFESAAPRKTARIGKFKTLSKGMKNWVMSDDTSLDEAMAAARNDEERELTSHQLDAFHSTFNFCMTCRQYTCGNCWNVAEGRCLTCAPNLGQEILGAPFPDHAAHEPIRIEAESWPEVDLSATVADGNGNGHLHDAGDAADPWASAAAGDFDEAPEFDAAARLAFLSGEAPAPVLEPVAEPVAEVWAAAVEIEAAPEAASAVADEAVNEAASLVADEVAPQSVEAVLEPVADAVAEPIVEIAAEPAAPAATQPEAVAEPIDEAGAEPAATDRIPSWLRAISSTPDGPLEAPSPPIAAAPQPVSEDAAAAARTTPAVDTDVAPPAPVSVEGKAITGSNRTSDLLRRFRPGQNIDAELAAFEADRDDRATETTPEPVAAQVTEPVATAERDAVAGEPAIAAEPDPVAAIADPEPEPEPVAAVVEPEPEPVAAAAPEPQPEAVAAAAPEPEPEPARVDRVEQPTWRIFAPDQSPTAGQPSQPAPPAPSAPPAIAASGEPQWPSSPDVAESPAMALLVGRANGSPSAGLWAASAQEVLAAPVVGTTAGAPAGVQPCSNCGLSLSATARFCRRCGSRQG